MLVEHPIPPVFVLESLLVLDLVISTAYHVKRVPCQHFLSLTLLILPRTAMMVVSLELLQI